MRYKRYKRRRSNIVKMRFQSFVDLSTEADTMKIISVNAGGADVYKRLMPFFQAYKYYKLGGVSIKLIPASTLPVDPTGLSYEAGEQTVDPRDQLTPGMCRITNGEDILEDLTGLTGDEQRALYNNMLLDPRWYKWMLQTGVKRYGKPKYWQIGQLHQDKWPGAIMNIPLLKEADSAVAGTVATGSSLRANTGEYVDAPFGYGNSSSRGFFQTGHRGVLGWLPTDALQLVTENGSVRSDPLLASIPEIELFKILMPPVHKTNYFYRAFITETVYFRDPIVMNINGFRPLDVFHNIPVPTNMLPSHELNIGSAVDAVLKERSGGNDGSN